jgi:hypothetical protein
MLGKRIWNGVFLSSVLAGGLLLVAGASPARADRDWKDDCHKRLEADRAKIDRDVARHGERSPQVQHDVARMDATRQWCRDHKADWDHDRFDIGVYFHH